MDANQIVAAIFNRRSVRKFKDTPVSHEDLDMILESGRWAPSGLNNQPWRFAIIRDKETRKKLAAHTSYGKIISDATCCIAVFYDIPAGYNRDKDILAIGACIQNMLLAAYSLGIGSVWLGEILNKKSGVNGVLGIDADNELMAVIAMGYPDEKPKCSRKAMKDLIIREY
jgi:nitroreductase